jgi:signal transduction histidine kinase
LEGLYQNEIENLRQNILRNISHQIRTDLNDGNQESYNNYLQVLEMIIRSGSEEKREIPIPYREIKRLDKTLLDLVTSSKPTPK